jgi:hypothetical protein
MERLKLKQQKTLQKHLLPKAKIISNTPNFLANASITSEPHIPKHKESQTMQI